MVRTVLGAYLVMTAFTGNVWAQGVITQQEALALAVPGATWDRRTAYLSEEDLALIAERAGPAVAVENPVITYYVAWSDGAATRVAYFDAHPVRTLQEVLMVVVRPDGRVDRVEVLKFSEPGEYRAPDGWLRQFDGHDLDEDVSLKGRIVGITGATLTARAVTEAVRRVLALHDYLDPIGAPSARDPR